MNIVTRDIRELNDITPINFQARKITFFEMKISGNFAGDIEDMLEGNTKLINFTFNYVELNGNVNVFDIGGNLFVVEYSDETSRNKDVELLKQRFEESGKFAKELEEERQIPEFEGYFDYEGKYYIIVNGLNKLTDEISPEKGVYKGVIVNPGKYFEVGDEGKKIAERINDIL
ncbi:MAG: hypothetical protein AB7E37_05110 [Candidatus Altimarinota bacterium]